MDQGTIILIILSFLTGLAAGYISGLLGIGAGVIMVPAAMFILDMNFGDAKALSLFVIMFTAPIGMWRHHEHGKLHLKTGLYLGIPGVCGSLLGVYIADIVDVVYLKILFSVILFFAAYRMITSATTRSKTTDSGFKSREESDARTGSTPKNESEMTQTFLPATGLDAFKRCWRSLPVVGFVGGVAAGLLGIGGGVIMVPSMVFLSYPMHSAVANSLMVVFMNAFAGTAAHAYWGEIKILESIPMMIGAVLSVRKGADMSVSIDRDLLRKYFGYFMILIGIYMVYRSFTD